MKKKDLNILIWSLVLLLPAAAWGGYVAERLWRWFIVPLGMPPLGLWECVGLLLCARYMTYDSRDLPVNEEDGELARAIATAFIMPAFVLAFGALYHAFAA